MLIRQSKQVTDATLVMKNGQRAVPTSNATALCQPFAHLQVATFLKSSFEADRALLYQSPYYGILIFHCKTFFKNSPTLAWKSAVRQMQKFFAK